MRGIPNLCAVFKDVPLAKIPGIGWYIIIVIVIVIMIIIGFIIVT